jgi:hypothetical protein
MKRLGLLAAVALGAILAASPARAQKVDADFDEAANFAAFKTFAFKDGTPAKNPLYHKRIVDALSRALMAEGMTMDENNPDVIVAYHGSTSDEVSIDTNNWGYTYGGSWRWGGMYGAPMSSTTTVRKYKTGTLVVDMWDARSKQLAWRGVASDTMSDKAEKNEKKINKAVEKMFKKYPPEMKKKK